MAIGGVKWDILMFSFSQIVYLLLLSLDSFLLKRVCLDLFVVLVG